MVPKVKISRRTWRGLVSLAIFDEVATETLASAAIEMFVAAGLDVIRPRRPHATRTAPARVADGARLEPAAPLEVVGNGAIGKAGASRSSSQRKAP